MSHICGHVYIGGKSEAKDAQLLEELQITHILNVTPPKTEDPAAGVPNFFQTNKHFKYQRCSLFDNKGEDILRSLDACIAFIDQAQHYGNVLVHCNKGISRSTSMVIGYLMKIKHYTFTKALEFVKQRRAIANPNEGFLSQLQQFEHKITRAKTVKTRSARNAIGPALPPSPPSAESICETTDIIGPARPITVPTEAIGPQMPPLGVDKLSSNDDQINRTKCADSTLPTSLKRRLPKDGSYVDCTPQKKTALEKE